MFGALGLFCLQAVYAELRWHIVGRASPKPTGTTVDRNRQLRQLLEESGREAKTLLAWTEGECLGIGFWTMVATCWVFAMVD